jgi:hypothetical protein
MIQILVWPCPWFPQIANTWCTGGLAFWDLLHPLVCAVIEGEMNVDSCPKVSSIRYRKATTHSFCFSIVYWFRIQTENHNPTQICCGFSSIRTWKLRDFMLQCTIKVSRQSVNIKWHRIVIRRYIISTFWVLLQDTLIINVYLEARGEYLLSLMQCKMRVMKCRDQYSWGQQIVANL